MPGGDRTGPLGIGPMSGRAAGYCAGNAYPFPGRGRSFGYGRGTGFGFRGGSGRPWGTPFLGARYFAPVSGPYPYVPTPSRQQLVDSLQDQVEYFENTIADLKNRIKELETKPSDD